MRGKIGWQRRPVEGIEVARYPKNDLIVPANARRTRPFDTAALGREGHMVTHWLPRHGGIKRGPERAGCRTCTGAVAGCSHAESGPGGCNILRLGPDDLYHLF